jgi:proline racemase
MMLEPLGHAGMYGVIPVKPSILEVVIDATFMGGLLDYVRARDTAEGQIDRSPTGVTFRMARDYAREQAAEGQGRMFCDPIGIPFEASVVGIVDGSTPRAGIVRVSSTSAFSGRSMLLVEARNPLTHGFVRPRALGNF